MSERYRPWIEKHSRIILKSLNKEDLIDRLSIEFVERDVQDSTTMACCSNSTLTIYTHFWERLSYPQRKELLTHELCHFIAHQMPPKKADTTGWVNECWDWINSLKNAHGEHWSNLIISAGYQPKTHYSWKALFKE